ncbi:MAG: glycosyltransferase family 39 protein [bacterium]|nr:glycosyltransferase family 39 protein [bacterium]
MQKIRSDKKSDLYVFIILTLIVCFFALDLWLWLGFKDYSIAIWESGKHMGYACEIAEGMAIGCSLEDTFGDWIYPPLHYLPAAILILITDHVSESIILLSLAAFLPVLIPASYKLGRKLDSPTGGLTLAFIAGAFFIMSVEQTGFMIDNMLCVWIMAGLCFLAASDGFSSRGNSCLFGISFGLGLMTKWSYPVFIILPFALSLTSFFGKDKLKKLVNLLLSALSAFIIAGPWYLFNSDTLLLYLTNNAGRIEGTPANLICPPLTIIPATASHPAINLSLSWASLPTDSPLLLGALCLSIPLVLWQIKKKPHLSFPLFSIAGAFIFLSLSPYPEQRYIRPALPLVYASMLAAISPLHLILRRLFYIPAITLAIAFSLSWAGLPEQCRLGAELFSINTAKAQFQDPLGAKTCFKTLNQERLAEEATIVVSSYPAFLADHDSIIKEGIIPEYLFKYHMQKSFLAYAYLYKNKPLNELLSGMKDKNLNLLRSSFPNSSLIKADASLVISSGNCVVRETYPQLSFCATPEKNIKKYYYLKSYTGHEMQRIRCFLACPAKRSEDLDSMQH